MDDTPIPVLLQESTGTIVSRCKMALWLLAVSTNVEKIQIMEGNGTTTITAALICVCSSLTYIMGTSSKAVVVSGKTRYCLQTSSFYTF